MKLLDRLAMLAFVGAVRWFRYRTGRSMFLTYATVWQPEPQPRRFDS